MTKSSLPFIVMCLAFSCSPPKELMEKRYSYSEIKHLICAKSRKHCIEYSNALYFLDEKYLFRYDKESGEKTYFNAYEIKEVVNYKGAIVTLDDSGQVNIFLKEKGGNSSRWVELGRSITGIEANKLHLVALTGDGQVWAYLGKPGDLRITYMPMFTTINNMTIVSMIPLVNGREMAFEPTGFSSVTSLDRRGNEIVMKLAKRGIDDVVAFNEDGCNLSKIL